jgi:hypothetical protein
MIAVMLLRSASNTLNALRATLLHLEYASDADFDKADLAALKGVFLDRLAELELAQAHDHLPDDLSPAWELGWSTLPPSLATLESLEEAVTNIPPRKLD